MSKSRNVALLEGLDIKKDFWYQEAIVNFFSRQIILTRDVDIKFYKSDDQEVYFIAEFSSLYREHIALVSVHKNSLIVHMCRSKSYSIPVPAAVAV